jgi:hypothetical protein
MNRTSSGIFIWPACLALVAIAGCADEPAAPPRFQINPQQAAQEALKLYDKNGDGTLDAKELKASPPLWDLLQNLKSQSSGHPDTLNAEDISGRLEEWVKNPTTLLPAMAIVYLDGKPLPGATVTLEPEPFLGPSYRSHQGQTNGAGITQMDPDLKEFGSGIYVGLYKVRISKLVDGKETLPARYNKETELGVELATDVRGAQDNTTFHLTSK